MEDKYEERRRDNKHWAEELSIYREEERRSTENILKAINHIETRILTTEEKAYVTLALKREARKEEFRNAVIQKTTLALVWATLSGLLYAVVDAIKHIYKS